MSKNQKALAVAAIVLAVAWSCRNMLAEKDQYTGDWSQND